MCLHADKTSPHNSTIAINVGSVDVFGFLSYFFSQKSNGLHGQKILMQAISSRISEIGFLGGNPQSLIASILEWDRINKCLIS